MCVCCRVGQEDVDIRLSGQFIKELHCVFCSDVEENGEGKTENSIYSDITLPPMGLGLEMFNNMLLFPPTPSLMFSL